MKQNNKIEILAPAGSFPSLVAAINAGADSIYFGVGQLNMRSSRATNFSIDQIDQVTDLCHKNNVKTYLTVNTIVYDSESDQVIALLKKAHDCAVTAVIASDLSVILKAREIGLCVHISTQLSISNIDAVQFFSKYSDRIVLARELSLEQIKYIIQEIKKRNIVGPSGNLLEIEVFAHGAMCVAVSGRCSMSLCGYNSSANRGQCVQVCRRKFKVVDVETNQELIVDNNYVMSASDLCTIGLLDKLIDSGITCLKIEGRGRPPEYVDTVVRVYRQALNDISNNTFNQQKIIKYLDELGHVYNRGFSTGFYLGLKADSWANISDNKSSTSKTKIGSISKYYPKIKVCEIKIVDKVSLKIGDSYLIAGPTTGVIYGKFKSFKVDDKLQNEVNQGDIITFTVEEKVRSGDTIFLISQ